MYLLDTNIWLERMLDQERADEVGLFLARTPSELLLMTDFTLHSIGVIMRRLNEHQAFAGFVQDVLLDGAVKLVTVEPKSMAHLVSIMDSFGLDFDDAYQYVAAERQGATLISFDADFDRTERGRLTPEAIEGSN